MIKYLDYIIRSGLKILIQKTDFNIKKQQFYAS
jgi:hypothetical protein